MKRFSTNRLLTFAAIGLLASSVATAAGAAIVRGDFSGVVNSAGVPFAGGAGSTFTGYYEYDDTTPALGPAPGVYSSGTAYAALSFVIDGASVGPSPVIAISDDYAGGSFDILWVLTGATGYPGLQLVGPASLWTGESLSVLNGLSLSDFSFTGLNGVSRSGNIDGSMRTWSQSPVGVPEPGTLALLGLGLAGLAATRRRKQ